LLPIFPLLSVQISICLDDILGQKASLNKYKKIDITLCILFDHSNKLECNNKSSTRKYSNKWRLNSVWLNDHWIIEKIKKEIKKFLKFNENENIIYHNLWLTAKAVLRGEFIAMSAYIKNTEISQINDLMLHLKLLEKQKQVKPKRSKWREIIKIRAKISKVETKKPHKESTTKKRLVL
jgi:hypothetical protein